jgi:Surface antigen variable number repeat
MPRARLTASMAAITCFLVLAAMLTVGTFPLKAAPQRQAGSKVIVADLRIEGDAQDVDAAQARILKSLEGREFDRNSAWLDQIAEDVREDFLDRGYLRADVSAVGAQPLDLEQGRMRVIVHVDQGDQYRVAGLTVVSDDPAHPLVIPEEELRKQFQLQTEDLFNVANLRRGLSGMAQLYGAQGYADFTATPDIDFDNKDHSISLKMEVNQGNQYHVERLQVLGLDSQTKGLLEARMPPGSIFNSTLLRELFDQGKAVVGADLVFDHVVHITRNAEAATADISIDFSGHAPHLN